MEELVQLVVKKTGLSEKQAKAAVDIVIDFIKKKLPAPVSSQIDGFLNGKSDLSNAADMLGGLLGGKK